MFKSLKNTLNKYNKSKSWKEFFASYLIDLDELYQQLENKTEAQQIVILKQALEEQTKKTGELVGEIARQKEQIEELENSNKQKDLKIKELEESQKNISLEKLKETVKDLTDTAERSKKTFAKFEAKMEIISGIKK